MKTEFTAILNKTQVEVNKGFDILKRMQWTTCVYFVFGRILTKVLWSFSTKKVHLFISCFLFCASPTFMKLVLSIVAKCNFNRRLRSDLNLRIVYETLWALTLLPQQKSWLHRWNISIWYSFPWNFAGDIWTWEWLDILISMREHLILFALLDTLSLRLSHSSRIEGYETSKWVRSSAL